MLGAGARRASAVLYLRGVAVTADLDALASALLDGIRAARRPGCPAWEALDRDLRVVLDVAGIVYEGGQRYVPRGIAEIRPAWNALARALDAEALADRLPLREELDGRWRLTLATARALSYLISRVGLRFDALAEVEP